MKDFAIVATGARVAHQAYRIGADPARIRVAAIEARTAERNTVKRYSAALLMLADTALRATTQHAGYARAAAPLFAGAEAARERFWAGAVARRPHRTK